MAFKDMREFLATLDKAGQLKNVDLPLDCGQGTNELQALMRYLAEINGPGLMLNNLQGYNMPGVPVIFNPFGTRERTSSTGSPPTVIERQAPGAGDSSTSPTHTHSPRQMASISCWWCSVDEYHVAGMVRAVVIPTGSSIRRTFAFMSPSRARPPCLLF